MPFDATVLDQSTVLDRLGLIPVPDEVLKDHKCQMERRLPPTGWRRWIEFYAPCGKLLVADQYNSYVIDQRSPCDRQDPLGAVAQRRDGIGLGPTPAAVTAVVEETEQRARAAGIETERAVGFYWTDPYICLAYQENGTVKRVCLAIWDGPNVLHIATLT